MALLSVRLAASSLSTASDLGSEEGIDDADSNSSSVLEPVRDSFSSSSFADIANFSRADIGGSVDDNDKPLSSLSRQLSVHKESCCAGVLVRADDLRARHATTGSPALLIMHLKFLRELQRHKHSRSDCRFR